MPRPKHSYIPDIKQSDCEIFIADKPISFVYFLRNPITGNVKIGTSGQVGDRIIDLSRQNKTPLEFIAAIKGNRTLETEIHKLFSKTALEHEWFLPSPELMKYIAKCPYHKIPRHEFPPPPKREYVNHIFSKAIDPELFNALIQLLELDAITTRTIKMTVISGEEEYVSRIRFKNRN